MFVQEVLRLLAAEPELARGSALPIPHGVREVIRQRLGLLDDASVRLLDVASVIGVEFERAVLSATARTGETDVASAIAHARKVGVLVDAGGGRERFGHALIRDAIYNDLPASRRVELHAAVADALERSHPDDPPLSEVAHHTILAGPAEADRLVDRSIRAARAFSDAYA